MEPDDLLAHAQSLRARGVTPKAIAKTLGITRAEADALVRRIAQASATGPALVGCWVNAGWSQGLSWSDHPEWHDDGSGRDDDVPDLVSVLVIREHRYDKLIACAYLVDAQCLGVKDALGPRELDRAELDGFVARQYVAYDRPPLRAPLELGASWCSGPRRMRERSASSRTATSSAVVVSSARGAAPARSCSATTGSRCSYEGRTTMRSRLSTPSNGRSEPRTSTSSPWSRAMTSALRGRTGATSDGDHARKRSRGDRIGPGRCRARIVSLRYASASGSGERPRMRLAGIRRPRFRIRSCE